MAVAPGNTMAALAAGRARGADMLELDVRLTGDGAVILFHDSDLAAITGVQGRVRDYPAAFLQTLDVGSYFDAAFAAERMPLLADVLAWARGKIPLLIELKHEPPWQDALEDKVIDLIEDFAMVDEVVLMAFDQFALARVRDRNPKIATTFMYHGRFLDLMAVIDGLGLAALSPMTQYLGAAEVRQIHAAGLACSPGGWQWNYPQLAAIGVDTVGANDPALVQFS